MVALVAAPGTARAGRTFFGWLYGSEVMPERGVELQSWITEQNHELRAETSWLLSAHIGVTDQLELGLPLEFDWSRVTDPVTMMDTTATRFTRFGIEGRYRFATVNPVDAPVIAPLLRVGVKRLVGNRDGVRPEVDLVISYESGRVQLLADLGFAAEVDPDDQVYEFRPGAGISVLAADELRFGVEAFSVLASEGRSWAIVGPDMSWTHGRFWISGAFGVGIVHDRITTAPRVQWGIAF
jgi:hypothetical protein